MIAREINSKRCALPRFAVYVDKPIVLFYDAKHGGQAEPRALAHLFGSEERFEDPLDGRRFHPNACVGHREQTAAARSHGGVTAARLLLENRVLMLHALARAF